MAQFHNAPSNFANLALGELSGANNLVQNNGKRNLFSQNWSGNDAKNNRLQDFYDVFDFWFADMTDKMTKTGTADLMKWASKIYF